ncbi:MAG: hypothetical protein ACR2P4_10415 [Gammaproteobacteria bacterium]
MTGSRRHGILLRRIAGYLASIASITAGKPARVAGALLLSFWLVMASVALLLVIIPSYHN